jgi:signal recognition particle receptor subunit beta
LQLWDIGGGAQLRQYWTKYVTGAEEGIIWVIDAADSARFEESRRGVHLWEPGFLSAESTPSALLLFVSAVLSALLEETRLRELPVLVLANKAELQNAETAEQIAAALSIDHSITSHVQLCSAQTGQGVQPGLSWLCTKIE